MRRLSKQAAAAVSAQCCSGHQELLPVSLLEAQVIVRFSIFLLLQFAP